MSCIIEALVFWCSVYFSYSETNFSAKVLLYSWFGWLVHICAWFYRKIFGSRHCACVPAMPGLKWKIHQEYGSKFKLVYPMGDNFISPPRPCSPNVTWSFYFWITSFVCYPPSMSSIFLKHPFDLIAFVISSKRNQFTYPSKGQEREWPLFVNTSLFTMGLLVVNSLASQTFVFSLINSLPKCTVSS